MKILVTHAMVVNPKEYLEIFMDRFLNEKQKGIKKGSSGLGFENFSQIIKSLVNFDAFKSLPVDTKKVLRLTATSGEMVKKTVTKSKLSQLNNERFYFNDGVVSLPFDHPDWKETEDFKQKKGQKIDFWEEKKKLFNMEKQC